MRHGKSVRLQKHMSSFWHVVHGRFFWRNLETLHTETLIPALPVLVGVLQNADQLDSLRQARLGPDDCRDSGIRTFLHTFAV